MNLATFLSLANIHINTLAEGILNLVNFLHAFLVLSIYII